MVLRKSVSGVVADGAAQLELLSAAVQQGRGAGQEHGLGRVGGQHVGVRYQSERGVTRTCRHKLGVLSVQSWICAPSRTELVLQYWSPVPKEIVCENMEYGIPEGPGPWPESFPPSLSSSLHTLLLIFYCIFAPCKLSFISQSRLFNSSTAHRYCIYFYLFLQN